MFRKNEQYKQIKIFGLEERIPVGVHKMLMNSWAPVFRKKVFERIDGGRYSVLYSEKKSRPNFPVNVWIGLEIIKGMNDLTDEELLEQFYFNYLVAYAVGLDGLGELTMSDRTLYYNRERLLEYEKESGRNLLEEEFKKLAEDTIKELSISTDIQRMDSSFVGSYIKKMSRLELLVKVLQNFYYDLTDEQRDKWKEVLGDYIEKEAKGITFRLKRKEIDFHIKRIGEILFDIHQYYSDDENIVNFESYKHISRILREQYNIKIEEGKSRDRS